MSTSKDGFYMSLAYLLARDSKDPGAKIGAVIVSEDGSLISVGINEYPNGLKYGDPSREARPEKYYWYEHGERNAIYEAARCGRALKGSIIYTQGMPCADCGRAIIQTGIREVVLDAQWEAFCRQHLETRGAYPPGHVQWHEHSKRTKEMFMEAQVKVRIYDGPLSGKVEGWCYGAPFKLRV